ncbi:MAG: ABC transporter permease [Synergistaceae bacterium]|jgi:peptide/nickel transport system permease protein|nr:ABC transporter permease [Synergistaceae bacterium]
MHKYIAKRLLLMIPVVMGISLIIFSIMSFMPGNPARLLLGEKATPEAIANLNEEMGLNDPFIIRYANYIGKALRGDFGTSYRSGLPVAQEIMRRFPTTLKLAVLSVLFAIVISVPLGILSAVKQYSWIDNLSTVMGLGFISVPPFWLGLLLIIFFSLELGWLPPFGSDSLRHFILPAVTSSASAFATLLRMTRSTMLEVIRQDYVVTAYAKGASYRIIVFKHCLRNALIPLITVAGVNFGGLLSGSIITESVFGMSGIGSLLISSIRSVDVPSVMACTLLFSVMFSLINLLMDIIYAYVDPRIKAQYQG